MLSSKIHIQPIIDDDQSSPDAEDILSSSLALFPDDTNNIHGDPGGQLIYKSSQFGDVRLKLADPGSEDLRRLFAHYVWNASVYVAERLSEAWADGGRMSGWRRDGCSGGADDAAASDAALNRDVSPVRLGTGRIQGYEEHDVNRRGNDVQFLYDISKQSNRDYSNDAAQHNDEADLQDTSPQDNGVQASHNTCKQNAWNVQGQIVLELGAGAGLGGIISALCGAGRVVISDYPSPLLLKTLEINVDMNVREPLRESVTVVGHAWGATTNLEEASLGGGRFTRILAADCLWMPHQHAALVRSIVYFLSPDPDACALIVAGLHTGRGNVAAFFELAVKEGLAIDSVCEVDVDGVQREWERDREESVTERKRWVVVAVLRHSCSHGQVVVEGDG